MEFLSSEQEKILRQVLDYCALNGKWNLNCQQDNVSREIVESLIIDNYIENFSKASNYGLYLLLPTQKGKDYLVKKGEALKIEKAKNKKERNAKIADWIKYGITTSIALAALFIAIFC